MQANKLRSEPNDSCKERKGEEEEERQQTINSNRFESGLAQMANPSLT